MPNAILFFKCQKTNKQTKQNKNERQKYLVYSFFSCEKKTKTKTNVGFLRLSKYRRRIDLERYMGKYSKNSLAIDKS